VRVRAGDELVERLERIASEAMTLRLPFASLRNASSGRKRPSPSPGIFEMVIGASRVEVQVNSEDADLANGRLRAGALHGEVDLVHRVRRERDRADPREPEAIRAVDGGKAGTTASRSRCPPAS
jgi:hypothetical protein